MFEGRALAKLAHPNVVAVHDVGAVGDQVYLVMEWVRGETCARTAPSRERCARSRAYRAAGEGLASGARRRRRSIATSSPTTRSAARRPRTRARLRARRHAALHGTRAGGRCCSDRGADQYAFCVALDETLAQRGPLPRWLDAIVERGKRAEPAERFPAMTDLSRALARDPAIVWRRRAVVAGALVLAGTTFAVGSARGSRVTPCDGDDAPATWNANRVPTLAHVRALGTYGAAEAARLDTELTRTARSGPPRSTARVSRTSGTSSPSAVYERSLGCLARARASYETVIDVLATTTAPRLGEAIERRARAAGGGALLARRRCLESFAAAEATRGAGQRARDRHRASARPRGHR